MKPAFELDQVIDRFGQVFETQHTPNTHVQRTLRAIQNCRTSALGGHVDQCDTCGHIRISYNSCRNRHCPKCQNTQREQWIEKRQYDLLPVRYFHVVFTVPDKLNSLFLHKPALMYNLLYQTVWQTISQFSYTTMQSQTGMFALLHTWGQNLSLHPHIHCVIPGGGIDYKNRWREVKVSKNNKAFLFPVRNLSSVFRGKFIAEMQRQLPQDKNFIKQLRKTPWVVYAKEPFASPAQVVEYLGRYSHKVAISNHRITNIGAESVSFRWRDYRDNKEKIMTFSGAEFLRRFSQHILPKRFVRIRHYGLLSTKKRPLLRQLQQAFGMNRTEKKEKKDWKQICREHLNFDPDICPICKKGVMQCIETFLPGRSPPLIYILNKNYYSNIDQL